MNEEAFSDPARERQIFVGRVLLASLLMLAFTAILIARYFDLQINQHQDFVTQSDNNRVHMRPNPPARGVIYDRNGEMLADNQSVSNLTIIRERSNDLEKLIENIGTLVPLSESDVTRFYKRLKRRRPFEQTPIKFNLSEEEQAILAVNEHRLDGVKVSARYEDKDSISNLSWLYIAPICSRYFFSFGA